MGEELVEIKNKLISIEKLLLGNGKVGIAEMARRAFTYCQWHKGTRNGLLDWAFRIAIMIILGYVAVKVGLK